MSTPTRSAVKRRSSSAPTVTPPKRGFAALNMKRRREIARKGGQAVASIPGHLARIGAIGGNKSKGRPVGIVEKGPRVRSSR